MTIAQAERFYNQDNKEYEIENNKELLSWIRNSINNGYHCFIETQELQELIDRIVNWYEMKYPERELEYYEGIRRDDFKDIERLSKVMDINQLFFRIPSRQLSLLRCGYRAKHWSHHLVDDKESIWKVLVNLKISHKYEEVDDFFSARMPYFFVSADCTTGEVQSDYELEEYVDTKKRYSLDDILAIFKEKYSDELDFTELQECINDMNYDRELRNRILQLAALKIMYSRNTTPERGYERAKRFINEFNKKMGLNLSTSEIDEIMSRNYNESRKVKEESEFDEEQMEFDKKQAHPNGITRMLRRMFGVNKRT